MSREKQIEEIAIEEMAKVLKDYTKKNNIMASHVILDDYAEALYTAGYRKQSEAECLDTGDEQLDKIESGYKCSVCGFIICGHSGKYCSECGAKMKGGAG